jgi:hypothetical protein
MPRPTKWRRENHRFYAMAAASSQGEWRETFRNNAKQQAKRLQDIEQQLHGVFGRQEDFTLPEAGDPNPETDEPPEIQTGQQVGDEMHAYNDLPTDDLVGVEHTPNTELSQSELLAAAAQLERDNVQHAEAVETQASDEQVRSLWSEFADAARMREGKIATEMIEDQTGEEIDSKPDNRGRGYA